MTEQTEIEGPRRSALRTRFSLWRAQLGGPKARAIRWQPQPPWPGDAAAARRMARGLFLLEGRIVEAPGKTPWEIDAPDAAWERALHGMAWLDDFAALTEAEPRAQLAGWVFDWIVRFGRGRGPGWTPELVARRLMRWIGHAPQLLGRAGAERSQRFFAAVGAHAHYLGRIWRQAPPGPPRVEALAGLLYAGLCLEDHERLAEGAEAALADALDRTIADDGAIASRDADALAQLLELSVWTIAVIEEAGQRPDRRLAAAAGRIAPVLRAIHAPDGRLPRFHGAGRLSAERISAAIDRTEIRPGRSGTLGLTRIAAGPAVFTADAARPGPAAYASALAFELWLGGAPVIANAGTGAGFGAEATEYGRSLGAHSGLQIGSERVPDGAAAVTARVTRDESGFWFRGESAVWRAATGLLHERRIFLGAAGNRLTGEDTLVAPNAGDRARHAKVAEQTTRALLRFHLHPDIRVESALGGRAAMLSWGAERWMLRQNGAALTMGESRFFEPGHLAPRPTRVIRLEAPIRDGWARIGWSLEPLDARPGTAQNAAAGPGTPSPLTGASGSGLFSARPDKGED